MARHRRTPAIPNPTSPPIIAVQVAGSGTLLLLAVTTSTSSMTAPTPPASRLYWEEKVRLLEAPVARNRNRTAIGGPRRSFDLRCRYPAAGRNHAVGVLYS